MVLLHDATPHLAGCDADAQDVLQQRFHPILAFLQTHLGVTDEWSDSMPRDISAALQARYLDLEQRLIQSRLGHLELETKAHIQYRRNYLAPLAQSLGLYESVQQAIVVECDKRGLFGRSEQQQHAKRDFVSKLSPQLRAINNPTPTETGQASELSARVLAVWSPTLTQTRQASAFFKHDICPTQDSADAVATAFGHVERRATNRARGLVLASIKHGWIGVLCDSSYTHAEPLFLLQLKTDLIMRLSTEPLSVLAMLRADVISLQRTLLPLQLTWKEKGHPRRFQKLWLESLLHMPPDDQIREHYQQRLTAETQQLIVQRLIHERACSDGEGMALFENFCRGGLPLLIDWRCSVEPQTTQQTLVRERLAETARRQLAVLQPDHRQHVTRLVNILTSVCQQTGTHLPIARLLSDPPSSAYRRRLGRRLRFGFGALTSNRMRGRKRRRVQLGRRRSRRAHVNRPEQTSARSEDRLVEAFSLVADLSMEDDYREARTLLRQFVTYGTPGFLPKALWPTLLDERVMRALAFYKLAHPAGTTRWEHVIREVQSYAGSLGLVPPSSHIAQVVFNSVSKPVRWHGGDGPAMRGVRQRQTLMLNAPRICEHWIVLPLKKRLNLHIVDDAQRIVSETCAGALVFDMAIERPVGYWLSVTPIRSQEIGLLLYQAIFHPGALTWPLRGVPGRIEIPETLLAGETVCLERAASSLLSKLDIITRSKMDYTLQNKMIYGAKLLDDLSSHAPDYIRWKTGSQAATLQHAMDALRTWLYTDKVARADALHQSYPRADCFPQHNAPDVPAHAAQYGVALPGQHLPAAGWLLPVAEHRATTTRNAVSFRGLSYSDVDFQSEPGYNLTVRLFPYWYRDMEDGIFVEVEPSQLRYLVYQP